MIIAYRLLKQPLQLSVATAFSFNLAAIANFFKYPWGYNFDNTSDL